MSLSALQGKEEHSVPLTQWGAPVAFGLVWFLRHFWWNAESETFGLKISGIWV